MINIKVKIDKGAFIPKRAHPNDAGLDIRTPVDIVIKAGKSIIIDTGVHILIPAGYAGFLKSKSGLNVKNGLTGEGVIDAGYTGSIVVKLYNHSEKAYYFLEGDKIIQLVLLPIITPDIELVDSFEETERGSNGFGSSGR